MKKTSEDREIVALYSDASFSKEHEVAILGSGLASKSGNWNPETFEACYQVSLTKISERNNIRAEIRAALLGLSRCAHALKVILHTDCKTISELPGRRKNLEDTGYWSRSKDAPLANADLYKAFFKVFDELDLEIVWVKGHSKSSQRTSTEQIFSKLDAAVRRELRKVVVNL